MRTMRLVQLGVVIAIIGLSGCRAASGSFAAPALGVVIDNDFLVLDTKKGSASEQAGIQTSDVLLSLNGQTNLPPDEWREILAGMDVGQKYQVTVQRGDEKITLTVIARRDPVENFPPGATATPVPSDQYYF